MLMEKKEDLRYLLFFMSYYFDLLFAKNIVMWTII